MAIWSLEADSDFTEFYFPIKEDEAFFYETIMSSIENSKQTFEKWRLLHMLRAEPKKHPDFFEINNTDVIAVSQKAVDGLNCFLDKGIELLPIETDAGKYYALNVLNFVDCLDMDESKYTATSGGTIVSYSLLEFDEQKLSDNVIFKVPQLPYQIFISEEFSFLYEELDLQGLVFDPKFNLIWYKE